MRFPVYSHRSNPTTDKPLIRKKIGYVQQLIDDRQAFWIDESQKHLGVILRAKLLMRDRYEESLNKTAGSGFDQAWHILQSGYAGPLVYQLLPVSL